MNNLIVCPINGGKCRSATDEEQLDWDRRQYLQVLCMNPDDPRLQHLYPAHLRKPEERQISFAGWDPDDVAAFMRS